MDLISKINIEYNQGFEHIRNLRENKRNVLKKFLEPYEEKGKARVNLLYKNLQMEKALFSTDKADVTFICNKGVLGDEIMKNANLVAQFDYEDMELKEIDDAIIDDCGLYGIAVTVLDGWDNEEKQPLVGRIDPLCVIPDPKNYQGSKMRFIGFERQLSIDSLRNNSAYKNIDQIIIGETQEQISNDRAINEANNTTQIMETQDLVSVYDHFTSYNGKKRLVTLANDRTLIIRDVEIAPLTEAEIQRPNKVKFPVQLHRRKPKINSFFGVSLPDEVLEDQDLASQLLNLQMAQSRQLALGPDKFISSQIGIDTATLASKKIGGRIIPVNTNGAPVANMIYSDTYPNPSQFPTQLRQELVKQSEDTTGLSSLVFGQSQVGIQTKAEAQTLMKNANQILSWIGSNYLTGKKAFWEQWYKSYALNMSKKSTKVISLYQKGNALSLELKYDEFIADGKVQVIVESKSQKALQHNEEFIKLNSLIGTLLPNMRSQYSINSLMRSVVELSGIESLDKYEVIPMTVDEQRATDNLELLNNNVEVSEPQEGEDYLTYIFIYRQALNTKAKDKALMLYQRAWEALGQQEVQGEANQASTAMAMNSLNSKGTTPSVQDVTF